MRKQIAEPISGGLILSYKCPSQCRHCMYACSPKWKADWISEADLEKILVQLSNYIEPSPYGSQTVSLNNGLHFTGRGISLGDFRDLDNLLGQGIETEEYPILGFLIDENLKGLFQFSKDLGYQESEEGYFSKCHLCMDIRKHLVRGGEFKELKPKEFYLHLE